MEKQKVKSLMYQAFSSKIFLIISACALWFLLLKPELFTVAIIGILIVLSAIWVLLHKDTQYNYSSKYFITAAMPSIFFAIPFYDRWIPSSKIQYLTEKVGLNSEVVVFVITIIAILVSLPFSAFTIYSIAHRFSKKINSAQTEDSIRLKKLFNDILSLRKSILILFAVLCFAMIAIIRANVNYADDVGRVLHGYSGWENHCRYVSTFLSRFIHADTYLHDVSPFPQVLALLIMAITGIIALYIFTGKTKFSIWEYAAVLPLCLSPHFLACLSFKYDSPYMSLSVLFSIFPFLFKDFKLRYYALISFIMMWLMCMTYQASSGIYIVMVIFLAFKAWNTKEKSAKNIIKWVFVSAMSYIPVLAVFKLIYNQFQYASYNTSIYSSNEIFSGVLNNINVYFDTLLNDSKSSWIILIGLIFIGYLISVFMSSKQNKLAVLTISVSVILVSSVFSQGAICF